MSSTGMPLLCVTHTPHSQPDLVISDPSDAVVARPSQDMAQQLDILSRVNIKCAFPAPAANFDFFASRSKHTQAKLTSSGSTPSALGGLPQPSANFDFIKSAEYRQRVGSCDSGKGSLPSSPVMSRRMERTTKVQAPVSAGLKVHPFKRKASAPLISAPRSSRPASPLAQEVPAARGNPEQQETQKPSVCLITLSIVSPDPALEPASDSGCSHPGFAARNQDC
jgi:hypothetical protein